MKQEIEQLVRQGEELPPLPRGTEGELTVFKLARAVSEHMFNCQVYVVRPVEWAGMIVRETGALKAGNCLAYFTDEDEANRYATTRNAFSALLSALREQDEEIAKLTESNFSLQRTLDKAINSLATVSAEAERLRAELARAVVLPCKVGDTIWSLTGIEPFPCVINEIRIGKKDVRFYGDGGFSKLSMFGKTWVLTRAEAAMHQGDEKKGE